MSTPATPLPISEDSQAGVITYLNSAMSVYSTSYNIRAQLLQRDLAYYREQDLTTVQQRSKQANLNGDAAKLQNVTVPVVMPQTESALAYQADVFLTGYPIFATVAPPEQEEAQKQFDAIITDNSIVGAWPSELMKVMRDGLKYDLGAAEVVWEKRKIYNIETPDLKDITKGQPVLTNYEGNFIKRLDPYNLILDTRVDPDKNHLEGEFAGYTECLSRIAMKKRIEDLDRTATMNFKAAFESGSATITTTAADAGYFVPTINPDALLPVSNRYDHDWMQWANLAPAKNRSAINYHSSYEWTVLYCRIIPADFGMFRVPNPTNVQIWKFIIVNRSVVIYSERQTNAHNMLPIIVCKPSNDAMGWQSKSFSQNAEPIQQIASSLMNSGLASQRRKVYDRLFYDPTKVRKEDIENTSPVARIPVKNSQFGKGFEGAVYSQPYNDTGVADIIQMSQQVVQMGEILNGQNRVQMGQFQKGNKTRAEFTTTMGNANSRQQMASIGLEYTFWSPVKFILKMNMLQFQQPGTIMNAAMKAPVKIDPTALRTAAISFKLSDGLLSTEKIASLDVANTVIQAATQLPMVAQEYDIMGIVEHTWTLQGITWLNDYKRDASGQAQYLSQLAQNTAAQGEMPPGPPGPPPDAGAQGALQ